MKTAKNKILRISLLAILIAIELLMFFTVTAEGKELQKRRYYFSETFAAIGCAEYYKATKQIPILCEVLLLRFTFNYK